MSVARVYWSLLFVSLVFSVTVIYVNARECVPDLRSLTGFHDHTCGK